MFDRLEDLEIFCRPNHAVFWENDKAYHLRLGDLTASEPKNGGLPWNLFKIAINHGAQTFEFLS